LKISKLFFLSTLIALISAFLDLISKKVIFDLIENHQNYQILGIEKIEIFSFFNLVKVWNKGVSFGMFNDIKNPHIILSLLQSSIAVFIFIWICRNKKFSHSIALGLILGGAMGNVIDRIINKAVADFLDFHLFGYHWPAFNLADSLVFIGVAILLFDDLFIKKNEQKK
jgi:signal peptidase II